MDIGYRAQLPGTVALKRVQLAPGNGAVIGQGLQELGKTILQVHYADRQTDERVADSNARIAEIERQRARGQAVADGMGRLAQAQLDAEDELQALKDKSDPGAPGFAAQAEEIYRRRWQEFRDTLPDDDKVLQHFDPIGARWTTTDIGRARDWERSERTKNMGANLETSLDTQSAGLLSNPDPESLKVLLNDYKSAIDMQLLPGNDKAKLQQIARARLTGAMLDGMIAKGGDAAVDAAFASGELDWMGPDAKARYLKQASTVRDVRDRQAEAAANEAQKAALATLDSLEVDLNNGNPPATSDINAAIAAAKAAGVAEADLKKFGYLAEDSVRAKAAQGMDTGAIEGQLATLQAKRGAGTATRADVAQIDALQSELKGRDTKDADKLTGLKSANPVEVAGDLAKLQAMPVDRRMRVAREANDAAAGILAALPLRNAMIAAEGRNVLANDKNAYMPRKEGKDEGDRSLAEAQFRAALGPQLTTQLIRTKNYEPAMDAALALYAGSMARAQQSGWSGPAFQRAVRAVFGGREQSDGTFTGGIGTVRGRVVQLPDRYTASDFDAAMSRMDFRNARYAGGGVATKADVLQHYTPVYVGDSAEGWASYALVDAQGRELKLENGRQYQVRFKPVARR